jgi:hypothetical protein
MSRHRRRHSSVSGVRPTLIQMGSTTGSSYSGGMPMSVGGSYGGYGGYGTQPMPIQATNSVAFPGQAMSYGGMSTSPYATGGYPVSTSPYSNGMYGVPQTGSTVVVQTPSHRHKHRHRSHSRHGHRRSRSHTIDTFGSGMGAHGIAGTSIGAPQVYRY